MANSAKLTMYHIPGCPFSERVEILLELKGLSGVMADVDCAVELPENSNLTTLFKPGAQYRFTSEKFDGFYRVLEAYATPQEALLMYPEGLAVDASKGDYLHWRKFTDATSGDVTAWAEVK